MDQSFGLVLVGAGNMGGAMLAGWLESGFPGDRITVVDPAPKPDMLAMFSEHGVRHLTHAPTSPADVLIVAVKPQMMAQVLPGLSGAVGENTVIVSVAAGTTISSIGNALGEVAIVRAMPNTPALLRMGITGCFANTFTDQTARDRVDRLLQAVGKTVWVDEEKLIDAVTAVSGSGPAYVFHLAECMAAAGRAQGLPDDVADQLARHTISGAGAMLAQLAEPAGTLRENVTSPNGTTQAALEVLMADDRMAKLFSEAIAAARKRAEALSG